MNIKHFFFGAKRRRLGRGRKRVVQGVLPKNFLASVNKRQKFVVIVVILSLGLFISEYLFGKSGFFVVIFLSAATAFLFFLSVYQDIGKNKPLYVYIIPLFLYTLAVGLFYFLVPARFLSRVILTSAYAVGLYSLCLSQNIFIVASLRTIPLLSGARIVSFAITLLSYFFLTNVFFSLDIPFIFNAVLLFLVSFIAVFQSLAITSEKSLNKIALWSLGLSLCLFEASIILWFWPIHPTFLAIFLSGFFYAIIGVSQVWLEKRLFRGVMWEYIWVGVLVLIILLVFTSWRA